MEICRHLDPVRLAQVVESWRAKIVAKVKASDKDRLEESERSRALQSIFFRWGRLRYGSGHPNEKIYQKHTKYIPTTV